MQYCDACLTKFLMNVLEKNTLKVVLKVIFESYS